MAIHGEPVLLLTALRVVSAIMAGVLVGLAFKAWQASRDTRMARLVLGFGLLLVSLLIEGAVFQLLVPGNLAIAHVVEAGTQLAAIAVLIWALF